MDPHHSAAGHTNSIMVISEASPMADCTNHDNTRRAETALASVTLGNSFLHRMRILNVPYPFHGDDMLPIDTHERSQTSVDRRMVNLHSCRVELGHHL